MTLHIDLTSDQFKQWVDEFPEAVQRALEAAVPTIREMVKGLTPAPGSTGELAESVEVTVGPAALKIEWMAPYAQYVEFGAEPHTILPRTAKALKFMTKSGEIVYRKRVEHPGYSGWHFLDRIAATLTPVLKAMIEMQLQAIERGI